MNNKPNSLLLIGFGLMMGVLLTLGLSACKSCSKDSKTELAASIEQHESRYHEPKGSRKETQDDFKSAASGKYRQQNQHTGVGQDIAALTKADVVVSYVKAHAQLPDYYITKKQAKAMGWHPGSDLCKSVPGKAIGGDRFTNREGSLPKDKGQTYTEADINYNCGHRNADRLVFSNDGHVYVTFDHYKSFEER